MTPFQPFGTHYWFGANPSGNGPCLSKVIPQTFNAGVYVDYPHIVLTPAEASRFFWLLESFTLVPSGSVTNVREDYGASGEVVDSHSATGTWDLRAVFPDLRADLPGESDSCFLLGFIGESVYFPSDPFNDFPLRVALPPQRVCKPAFVEAGIDKYSADFLTYQGLQNFHFGLVQVGDEIRLYYTIRFYLQAFSGDVAIARLLIQTSDRPSADFVEVANGTFTLAGKEFAWSAFTPIDDIEPGPFGYSSITTVSGLSLDVEVGSEQYYVPTP